MCHKKSKANHKSTSETNAAKDDNDDKEMKTKRKCGQDVKFVVPKESFVSNANKTIAL